MSQFLIAITSLRDGIQWTWVDFLQGVDAIEDPGFLVLGRRSAPDTTASTVTEK